MTPDLQALRQRLSEIAGAEQVQVGAPAAAFAVDGVAPRIVARPGTQDEVAKVVAACAAAGATVAARGGGASMGLGNVPSRLEVVVSLDRLTRIVEFDEANLNVSAEAGVRLDSLQAALARKREFLPLDPPQADRITIGGLVAANASGPTRLLYGPPRDWILGLRLVLPDGERIRCGGKVIKNVSGYDMNKLFIGSLGTLGIVTEATFKLLPCPGMRATLVGVFSRSSQAASVVARTLGSHLLPEAMEALDPQAFAVLAAHVGLPGASGHGLAVALAGSRETVERQVRDFQRYFAEAQAEAAATLDESQGDIAWRSIRDVHAELGGTAEERTIVKIAVPVARTLEMLSSAESVARRNDWRGFVTAHAGSGIVRAGYRIAGGTLGAIRREIDALRGEAEGAEGALVVEAAPLALKQQLDAWGKPRDALPVMRRVKAEFDPRGLMSPGRFVGGI